jgi:hypothetical protein
MKGVNIRKEDFVNPCPPDLKRTLEFLFLVYNSTHDKICICPVIDKCIAIPGTGKT